jgi:hypothetical protein
MEKKKRRKPEIGSYDVIKVPVVQVSQEQQTDKPKVEPKQVDVKEKRNSCFLC